MMVILRLLGFILPASFSRSYSRLGQMLQRSTFGIVALGFFYRLDAFKSCSQKCQSKWWSLCHNYVLCLL